MTRIQLQFFYKFSAGSSLDNDYLKIPYSFNAQKLLSKEDK